VPYVLATILLTLLIGSERMSFQLLLFRCSTRLPELVQASDSACELRHLDKREGPSRHTQSIQWASTGAASIRCGFFLMNSAVTKFFRRNRAKVLVLFFFPNAALFPADARFSRILPYCTQSGLAKAKPSCLSSVPDLIEGTRPAFELN